MERKAFGVTIASFQAIQHRLADLIAAGEGARLLVYRAAWNRQNNMEGAANRAAMAFLFLSELAFKTCREALQFHGGYGYTLDFDIQLYLRRARTLAAGHRRIAQRVPAPGRAALSGKPGAIMDFTVVDNLAEHREQARAWVAENLPEIKEEANASARPATRFSHEIPPSSRRRRLLGAGWPA